MLYAKPQSRAKSRSRRSKHSSRRSKLTPDDELDDDDDAQPPKIDNAMIASVDMDLDE
jgi:hypothetical protein